MCAGVPSHSEPDRVRDRRERVRLGELPQAVGHRARRHEIDDANVSGKISVKPIEFAVSGVDENSPTSAKIHENA